MPPLIEIWHVPARVIDACAVDEAAMAAALSSEERERYRGFACVRDARTYGVGHVELRRQLDARIGSKTTATSMSRGGGGVAFAIGDGVAFGIDLVDPGGADWDVVGREFFTAAERSALDALEPGERARVAARFWGLKESVAKALRTGVSDEFARWSFASARAVATEFAGWSFRTWLVGGSGQRLVLACAARASDVRVVVHPILRVGHPA